jgi:predicted lysophospholipase L1 biosynthesis ABC-type transport system permease subunit
MNLTYEGRIYSFRVVDIINTNANMVFYDAEYIGMRKDMLCIRSSAEAGSDEARAIANLIEARGASLLPSVQIFMKLTKRLRSYSETINIATVISIITTLIGIFNILISSFITKRREQELYYSVGMTRSEVIFTIATEVLVCVICATIIAMVTIPLMMWLLDSSIAPWGVNLTSI